MRRFGVDPETRLVRLVEGERAVTGSDDVRAGEFECLDVGERVVIGAVDIRAIDADTASGRWTKVGGDAAFDRVEVGALRNVMEGDVGVDLPGDGAFERWRVRGEGDVDLFHLSACLDVQHVVCQRAVERHRGKPAAERRRISQRAIRLQRHRLDRRAIDGRVRMSGEQCLVARILEDGEVELVADALQVDVRDVHVGGVPHEAGAELERGLSAGANGHARDRGLGERRVSVEMPAWRPRDFDPDVVVRGQLRLGGRNPHLRRQIGDAHVLDDTAEIEAGDRMLIAREGDEAGRGGVRFVRELRRIEIDRPAVDLRVGPDAFDDIPVRRDDRRVGRDRALERIEAGRSAQVGLRVHGDVGLLLGVVQERREVEMVDGDLAVKDAVRSADADRALRRCIHRARSDADFSCESRSRPAERHIHARPDVHLFHRRHKAMDFGKRDWIQADLQRECRTMAILDRAVHPRRRLAGADRQVAEVDVVVLDGDGA